MNPKQTSPLLAALPALAVAAPPLIVGGLIAGAIYLVLDSLFPAKQKPPEAVPLPATTISRKPAETPVFRQIPAEIPAVKPVPAPVRPAPSAKIPTISVQRVPTATAPAPAPAVVSVSKCPLPVLSPPKKKFVSRDDLAAVFHRGARSLSRTAAVAALKQFGFGKTAAYAALTPDGRFSAWLQCAPDGIITWTDARKT